MGGTPRYTPSPFAAEEAREVLSMLPTSTVRVSLSNPVREELLDAVRECKIFHFASHGTTDPHDLSLSGLVLGDVDRQQLISGQVSSRSRQTDTGSYV
ncbi:hypothetical protein Hte_007434 [Hypoxylon texense]